jgi:hypothetical protein
MSNSLRGIFLQNNSEEVIMSTRIRTWPKYALVVGGVLLAGWQGARAATYYVDPANGLISNNGSSTNPWNTLAAVATAKTFAAGDSIFLRSGYHGAVTISGTFTGPVTFLAAPGQKPMLKSLRLNTARNMVFQGLTITPEATTPYATGTLVNLTSGATQNTVQSCTLYSQWDATAWDSLAWNQKTCNAMTVDGAKDTLRGNYLKNVNFGISVGFGAESTLVERNRIENFAGDGLRGLGDYGMYQYNFVSGCYDVNANHDDGFQSWSYPDGLGIDTVFGVVLRGNTIINYLDPNQPFRGTLQGIGCFGGFYKDWVVENNVVCVDHYHGISFLGAVNCRIVNNTVVDQNYAQPTPWIALWRHQGSNTNPSVNCIARNNFANSFDWSGSTGTVQDHNKVLGNAPSVYNRCFVNYAAFDFHLKSTAIGIDSASADLAPAFDGDGVARPYGNGVDYGAYEYVPVGIDAAARRARNALTPAPVTISPLPMAHEAIVRCAAAAQCRIYRPDGALAAKFNVPQAGEFVWKTAGLENGVYLLEATGGGAARTMKIVVRR